MPLGAYRVNSIARYEAPAAATETVATVSAVSWNTAQYINQDFSYVGEDSSGRPIWIYGYKNTSGTSECYLIRRNSDGTVTTSSAFTGDTSSGHATAIAMNNIDGNQRALFVWWKSGTGLKVKVFTIDKNNLSFGTDGTADSWITTNTAEVISICDMGNGKAAIGIRNSGIPLYACTVEGSGVFEDSSTLTMPFGDGVYQSVKSFPYNNDNIHKVIGYNGNSKNIAAARWTYTAGVGWSNRVVSSNFSNFLTLSSIRAGWIKAVDQTKAICVGIGTGDAKARVATVTWNTGTTVPTISGGTEYTLTDASICTADGCGFAIDSASSGYVVYQTSGGWKYSKLTVSGTSITESTPVAIDEDSNWTSGRPIWVDYQATSQGNLLVALIDDSSSNNPKFWTKVIT